jgi:hypothetical protein
MTADGDNSVTEWIGELRAGNREEASRLLWERYFTRLAGLAQVRLRAAARGPADGEDVGLRVFKSLFRGVAAGRFPELGNRDDLWRLLVTITARKAHNQRRNGGLKGLSNEEIARRTDCGLRTVERKLGVIRKRWRAEGAP